MEWYTKRTLGDTLIATQKRHGEKTAIIYNGNKWNYTQFKIQVDNISKSLIELGIVAGDNIAIWMTNRPEWIFIMYGVIQIGACIVPLNTRYRTDDLGYALEQSNSKLIFLLEKSGPINYQEMLISTMGETRLLQEQKFQASNYPDLNHSVIIGKNAIKGGLEWDEFIELGTSISDEILSQKAESVEPNERMMIAYTSGTTGDPKGVVHSHIPIRNVAERVQLFGLTCNDIHMSYLPLFHIYGFSEITMACVLSGACQILMDVFDAEKALDLASEKRATILHGFEAHWLDLLNAQKRKPRELTIRFGTLPSGVESTIPIAEEVQDVFCPTISGFGMSETWAFVSVGNLSHSREQRTHASGYPMNDYHFKIINPETGESQPTGIPGELLIKGYANMLEYWKNPIATSETIDKDGWIHSGDMAIIREDGMLVFMGRYKDMLKVGGENVSPAEIEVYLRKFSSIKDAAVVGYPDQRMAEVPVAFIITEENSDFDPNDIANSMSGKVASFKIPRHIFILDEFPMTSSGKVRKVELREEAKKRLLNK